MRLVLCEEISEAEEEFIKKTLTEEMELNSVDIEWQGEEWEKEDEIEVEPFVFEEKAVSYEKSPAKRSYEKAEAGNIIIGGEIKSEITPVSEITENQGTVCFSGTVFESDIRDIKRKKDGKEMTLVTLDITDFEDSVTVKMFVTDKEKLENIKKAFGKVNKNVEKMGLKAGVRVIVRGTPKYDDFAHEMVINARDISYAKEEEPKTDNAEVKRVELHLHTQMSQMDAVSSAASLIGRAVSWGHKAIAITDHGVVQSYPDAMKASDGKIKVIYGVEGYMTDDTRAVTEGDSSEPLTGKFVVFDLETTGLSKDSDKITEIGAVKIENGKITDRFSTFVNPERPIPQKIVELTSITDKMIANAPKIEEILPEFIDFCKGYVLVAHNAGFDTGFIKNEAKMQGIEYNFSHLDTLMLARGLYPELSNHRLSTLNKHLGVPLLHHHRAVDDAKATADIFIKMLAELEKMGVSNISELNGLFDMRAISKRNQASHIILLAKDLNGIRNIYEMVSESHLKYFYRTPRIPKNMIAEKREGIIVGSACEAGELFRAVVGGASDKDLEKIAEFYDYLEIQPIGNNAYLKSSDDYPHINTDEDLQNLNRRIVGLGEKMNKPVVATCDVHFLDADGANYRKILMHYKGFPDADNQPPLFFRTTEEMLAEFEYLGAEKAYEVVVTNTNKIADMVENVRPIPTKKCPPEIPGANEDIRNSAIKKAKEIYGDPLPDIVSERLTKELDSIIGNGFGVMYKIAQELVQKSNRDGYLVGSRGSVGSSLVAFLSGITEVNSLPAHYICPNCKNFELVGSEIGASGCDLPDKICPNCGTPYKKDGHDIPFETFLGFNGDKEPDIDLNFSGEYQPYIHKYTEEFFGEGYVFRAGTIGTVAKKTAFGYARKYAEEKGIVIRNAELKRLATGCVGVKRTSGQHPGGIIVVPHSNNIHEFCPIQHPADDVNSNIITTHFDYHSIDKNLLKLDELGHDDPTVIRMLEDLTGVNAREIPLAEEKTMSLFLSNDCLNLKKGCDIGTKLGTYAVPEFGTKFVRQMLIDTKPTTFSELVRISGLSHGTDVWLGNAQDYIRD
ncbi:MAG: PolC-type DNA polymerase III, partial [Clostridia bacterium]|nr:PolC-type DNA polymerase III [Clostridia bacterium]